MISRIAHPSQAHALHCSCSCRCVQGSQCLVNLGFVHVEHGCHAHDIAVQATLANQQAFGLGGLNISLA